MEIPSSSVGSICASSSTRGLFTTTRGVRLDFDTDAIFPKKPFTARVDAPPDPSTDDPEMERWPEILGAANAAEPNSPGRSTVEWLGPGEGRMKLGVRGVVGEEVYDSGDSDDMDLL